jgi:hypothetical protein
MRDDFAMLIYEGNDAALMLGALARRLYDELEWIATAIETGAFTRRGGGEAAAAARAKTARDARSKAATVEGYHGGFEDEKQRIVEMYRGGKSAREIAAALPETGETVAISPAMVRYILKREGERLPHCATTSRC